MRKFNLLFVFLLVCLCLFVCFYDLVLHQGERAVRQRHRGCLEEAGCQAPRGGEGSRSPSNRLGSRLPTHAGS
jgi:hypothetical protein